MLYRYIFGTFFGFFGIAFAVGGLWLASLGGSLYYLATGLVCLACAFFLFSRTGSAAALYGIFVVSTTVWALVEVGLDFWQMLPRIAGPALVALIFLWPLVRTGTGKSGSARSHAFAGGAGIISLLLLAAVSLLPDREFYQVRTQSTIALTNDGGDWPHYGNSIAGTRYSEAAQITVDNVGDLVQAWAYRTGDSNATRPEFTVPMSFMATPIFANEILYLCTPTGRVLALEPDRGTLIWEFDPDTEIGAAQMMNCRGVSYHQGIDSADCERKIFSATIDGRLLAINADDGSPCAAFGDHGTVSLREGLGPFEVGSSYTTSPPLIIGNTLILGAYVRDNFSSDEVSGVIRAFDVHSGELRWAWDAGAAEGEHILADGETWSRGSPNSWSVMSGDSELGLVFVPMGNATPDHVGMHRTPDQERFASSVVALDVDTGEVRWSFQTTIHDLWDFDVPAQPVLFDMELQDESVPVIAVPTKRGEIFILDRRNGEAVTGVEMRPVPQGDLPGETYAPTQPYQTGFPSLAPPELRETDMWGATPLDQMWCRIAFRRYDYEGEFTPPSTRGAIQYPGIFGAINWGSVSVDERNRVMVVNSSALPQIVKLYPREANFDDEQATHGAGALPQRGTPYSLSMEPMVSPLGIPCPAPPWGKLTAIDLNERSVAWQKPLGSSEDIAPLGIAVPGIFSIGGSITTGGGVVFIGATLDDYLRAFDTLTGEELWRGRLPAGGQATPMTYLSETTGRQYVVISAGGHGFMGTTPGDYVVAFALPD